MTQTPSASYQQEFRRLQELFLAEARAACAEAQTLSASVVADPTGLAAESRTFVRLIHNLRGAGGAHGFREISEIAAEIEDGFTAGSYFLSELEHALRRLSIAIELEGTNLLAPERPGPLSKRRLSILVAEDDPSIARIVSLTLSQLEVDAQIKTDGAAALDAILSSKPDLVFLDLMLPKLSGWDVLAAVRSEEQMSSLPIVVMSARSHLKDRQRAMSLGATAFLAKPFDVENVMSIVQQRMGE
ncbi:MAG: response regulator [Planctomycetota bacterium]